MSKIPHHYQRTMVATLVAALAAHGAAVAEELLQQPDDSRTTGVAETQLPSISVTAPSLVDSRYQNASIVDTEAVRSLRPATSDSASLLKQLPGVTLQGAGGVSSLPVIHGMADDRLRIKVDGMDLISACGNHMNPPLSYIDPTNVESVTVFAGITPVSLGGDSIGSTIQVNSPATKFAKPGEPLLYTGEAGSFYRSNGDAHGINAAVTLASDWLSLNYRGSTAEANDYRAGADFKPAGPAAPGRGWLDGDEVGSTMYKSTNHAFTLGMRQENHLVELKVGVQDIPYQGYPNQRMDMTGNDSTQTNLKYKGQYGWGELEARAYHEHTRHKMQFHDDKLYWYGPSAPTSFADSGIPCTPSPTCAAGMPMDTEGYNSGVVLKADLSLSERDLLRIGSEAQQYRLDDWWDPSGKNMWPNTFWNIHNGERDRLALFGEWEAQWDKTWLTQFGVRGEQVKMDTDDVQGYNNTYTTDATAFNNADHAKTDNNLDVTALARFTPDARRSVEFGLAQKTRSPNLYERYTWSTGGMAMLMINMAGDGNGYVGNLELEPEVARTLSATFDWHDSTKERWGLKATPYLTYVKDYIDAELCFTGAGACTTANLNMTDGFVFLKFVNQSARIYGMDISGHFPLTEGTRYGRFIATGMVSYTRGENETTGDNLYNMMPLNAKLAVKQHTGNWTNTVESELVDAKTNVSDTRNEVETAGYGLLHLRSSYEWKQARFDIGVENVLDRFYNHPLGGAYTGQGATMPPRVGLVPWGVAVPGMGRSIYAGVNVKF